MMSGAKSDFKAVRIFFTGVGGQGTLVATRLVGEAALEESIPVTLSEIHGMAQRGGVVESSVVAGNAFSPTIADGEADIMLAFEPLEAVRALPKCHGKTLVICNTVPLIPFTVAVGQSDYPSADVLHGLVREKVGRFVSLDAVAIAREAGTDRAANIVMVGVLAGMQLLPIQETSWEAGLQRILPSKLFEVNWKAFQMGVGIGAGA